MTQQLANQNNAEGLPRSIVTYPGEDDSLREDILLSICLPDLAPAAATAPQLMELLEKVSRTFRFWELIVIADSQTAEQFDPLIARFQTTRILEVNPATAQLRRRTLAAAEAIGDIVVLSTLDELGTIDIMQYIDLAQEDNAIVIGESVSRSRSADGITDALGRLSGFQVQLGTLHTSAFPRRLLSRLQASAERDLAMRFPPRSDSLPVIRIPANANYRPPSRKGNLLRRIGLIQQLLVNGAPRILSFVAVLSALVLLASIFLVIYAIGVLVTVKGVQPGWFSSTVVISLTAAFLALAIFGLAIGLRRLIDLLQDPVVEEVLSERGGSDLFSKVRSDLNIETDLDHIAGDVH